MSATGEDFAAAEEGRDVSSSSSLKENDDGNDDNVEKATSGRKGSRGYEEKEQKETLVVGDHDDPVTVVVVAEVVRNEQQVAVAVTSERFTPTSEKLLDASAALSSDEGEKGEGEVVVVGGGDHKNDIVDDEEVEETVGAVAAKVVVAGEGEGENEQEEVAEVGVTANAAVGIPAPTKDEVGDVAVAVAAAAVAVAAPPNNGGDEQIVVAMEVEPAAAVAAPGNEEAAIGEGVEAVYIAPFGRGSKINGKKQKYRNGTSITMQFEDDWSDGEHKDGVIVGYDCFNSCDCDMGICQQWNYMVRFHMGDGSDNNNNNNNNNDDDSSFLELVPEGKLVHHLSENNAYFLVKKHWGKLIEVHDGDDNDDLFGDHGENRARILRGCKRFIEDTTGAYAVDWDVFLTDLNRVPKIASINILSGGNYFGFTYDAYDDPCMNVLFLAIITECPNNVIKKLLELYSKAIDNHFIGQHEYKGFYEEWMVANPEGFFNIDPEILRVLLQHTKNHEEAFCFGYFENEFGLAPINQFLQRYQASITPDNNVVISPHVKVILEESCYIVSQLLAKEFMPRKSVLPFVEDGAGIGSLVLRFALECAAKNIEKCFNSKIQPLFDHNGGCDIYKSLLEIMIEYLGDDVDNRDLFHRYMKVYMTESNNDSISLVNCVLDSLPKQNSLYFWRMFWDIFEEDEWEGEDATASPRHPLFTAIRLECQYEIISDIFTKDPSILVSLDNYESLPPFAIVAATRSYKDYIHPKKGYCCSYKKRCNSKPTQAIICGTCTEVDSGNNNDLDATYELLRMNPAVIGNLFSPPPPPQTASGNDKKKNRKRSSINTRIVDDEKTTTQPLLRPSNKRVKKSSNNNNNSNL